MLFPFGSHKETLAQKNISTHTSAIGHPEQQHENDDHDHRGNSEDDVPIVRHGQISEFMALAK
jgi:hypothetical protein